MRWTLSSREVKKLSLIMRGIEKAARKQEKQHDGIKIDIDLAVVSPGPDDQLGILVIRSIFSKTTGQRLLEYYVDLRMLHMLSIKQAIGISRTELITFPWDYVEENLAQTNKE